MVGGVSSAGGGTRAVLLQKIRAATAAGGTDMAPSEIDRLFGFVASGGDVDSVVLGALGEFYWVRSRCGRDPDEPPDRALFLLLPVFFGDPSAVPSEVAELLWRAAGNPTLLTEGDREMLRGCALLDAAEEWKRPGLLDAVFLALERAARTGTAGDAGRADLSDGLGAALLVRFGERRQAGGDPDAADAKRAAECFRTAYLLSDPADPVRSRRRLQWAVALVNALGDDEASATGVEMLCVAVTDSATPEERRDVVEVLAERLAYDVLIPLPEAAFALVRAAVDRIAASSRPADADRSELLRARLALSAALYARDDPAAGESAIALSGERVDAAAMPSWLDGLAELLRAMCWTPSPALVEAAVDVYRRLIGPTGDGNLQNLLDLAGLLITRYRLDRTRSVPTDAVEILHRVLGAARESSDMFLEARRLLGVALSDVAMATGDDADIERAIAVTRAVTSPA